MKKTKLKFETLNLKFEVIAQKQLECIKGGYDSEGIQQHYAGSYNDSNQGNDILNETLNYSFRDNLLHVQYFPENVMLTSTYNDDQNDRYKPNLIGFAFQLLDRQLQLQPFDNGRYYSFDQYKPNLIGFAFQLLDRQLQLQPFDNGRYYSFDQV